MHHARRLATVLLVGCLVGAGHSPSLAQDPSESPSFGGYIELPARGVAVTLPEDWLAFDLASDIDTRAKSIEETLGDVFPAGREATVADLERRKDRIELLALSRDGQACELRLLTSRHVGVDDPEYYAQIDAAISAEPGIDDYTGIAPVELPAGPAVTWAWVQVGAGAEGEDIPHVAYMVDGGVHAAMLACEGIDPPADDWASIATTIEFPAVAEPSRLVGVGGRVEVESAGFALTLPADWVWARTSDAETEALVEALGASTDQGYAAEHRALLAEVEGISPLISWRLDGDEYCRVGQISTLQPLEELVAELMEAFDESAAIFPDGVTVSELELGGLEFVRLDYTQTDPELPKPWKGSHYMTVANRTYYYVSCSGAEAPPDRWLAISGTFELVSEK